MFAFRILLADQRHRVRHDSNIQLDQANGALSVNGETVPLQTEEQDAVALTAVKAQVRDPGSVLPSFSATDTHALVPIDLLSSRGHAF